MPGITRSGLLLSVSSKQCFRICHQNHLSSFPQASFLFVLRLYMHWHYITSPPVKHLWKMFKRKNWAQRLFAILRNCVYCINWQLTKKDHWHFQGSEPIAWSLSQTQCSIIPFIQTISWNSAKLLLNCAKRYKASIICPSRNWLKVKRLSAKRLCFSRTQILRKVRKKTSFSRHMMQCTRCLKQRITAP